MTKLELRDLEMTYDNGVRALAGLSLTVAQGELMVLLGPSGGGKTTALRLIAGLIRPTAGDVLFDDRTVLDVPPEKRGVVMVFQKDTLFPFRTVGENLDFGLRMHKVGRLERRMRVVEALSAVQMAGSEDRWPDELSGGQRQRVALARALVIRPELLLLDEPLTSLEPALRAEMREAITHVQETFEITTLMVTHDQVEAAAVADRIAVIIDGHLRQIGEPAVLLEWPADAEVAQFLGVANLLHGEKNGVEVHTDIGTLRITDSDIADGPVLVTIRPESIEMGTNDCNSFQARIDPSRFSGHSADCLATVRGIQLRFVAQREKRPEPGKIVTLHFPPELIRVLPGAAPSSD